MPAFTIVMAYYQNAGMLNRHFVHWRNLPDRLRKDLHVVIVDDGSPTQPAKPPSTTIGLGSLRMFRMVKDIPWNQDACRNLGMMHVQTYWALITDMDHLVPEPTIETLLAGKFNPEKVHRFGRVSAPDMLPYKPHPNSYFMTKDTYDRVGGYDERFAGYYGTDGMFLRACEAINGGPLLQLENVLVRYPREVVPDASTTRYRRKDPADKAAIDKIRKQIRFLSPEDQRPKRNTFPWHKVWPV